MGFGDSSGRKDSTMFGPVKPGLLDMCIPLGSLLLPLLPLLLLLLLLLPVLKGDRTLGLTPKTLAAVAAKALNISTQAADFYLIPP